MVSIRESNCIFVCQDQHVLNTFKTRYLNDSHFYQNNEEASHGHSTEKKTSIIGKLRRDVLPHIPLMNRVVDLTLGLTLFTYFWFFVDVVHISEILLEKALALAAFLEATINWLGEVPAGMKLNQELVHFLGLFYQYHIYLFRGYLELLSPHMPLILYTISLTSIPGLSCILSYTLSFSVILLLHIHCFYAYACNLYSAQLKALISLGRLFAGIKFNPLRKRVDSVRTQGDQLILGTLLFSVLLFLFPTTLLYYCVFTLVKLVLLVIQMSITSCISILRTCPFQELFQIMLRDPLVIDDVMIQCVTDCQEINESSVFSDLQVEIREKLARESNYKTEKSYSGQEDLRNFKAESDHENVFIVTAVYKSIGECLKKTRVRNSKLSLRCVRDMCLRGDIIKISF